MNRVLHGSEPIKAVITHSFSRFARNVTDLAIYLRELKKVRARLVSVTQDVDDSLLGKCVTLFYGLVDEMNSAENSKHVKRARRENARRGFFNGSAPPFGYKIQETKTIGHTGNRKVLVENESESVIVKEIYDLYEGIGGMPPIGMKKIVEHLNSKCLYRGQKWRVQVVQKILSDSVYTGIYLFNGRVARIQPFDNQNLEDNGNEQ